MIVDVDGFSFDFRDALDAFVFDEQDNSKPTFHGQPMKAVDIVAEFNDAYVYVEIKDFPDPEQYNLALAENDEDVEEIRNKFNWLKDYLKYKYRDSYLYRHAECKVEKPIHYICLLNFSNSINNKMQKALTQELPVGKASTRWKQEIVMNCQVVNLDRWNKRFPKWPVSRIDPGIAA